MMTWLLKLTGGSQLIAGVIVLLAALIFSLIMWGSGYWAGRARAEANCQTTVLEASNKQLLKDLADQREIASRANARTVVDAAELSTLRTTVEDLKHEFSNEDAAERQGDGGAGADHQRGGCTLSPDDARRLRNIR